MNDVASLLALEEDILLEQDNVYFNSYSIIDYNRGAPRNLKLVKKKDIIEADTKKAKLIKIALYKIKLLLTNKESPIRNFKGKGSRISIYIYFNERPNWLLYICIKIKAQTQKQLKIKIYKAKVFQIYKQTIRLNIIYIISAEPEVYIYKKAFLRKKGNVKDYLKEAYINYYIYL